MLLENSGLIPAARFIDATSGKPASCQSSSTFPRLEPRRAPAELSPTTTGNIGETAINAARLRESQTREMIILRLASLLSRGVWVSRLHKIAGGLLSCYHLVFAWTVELFKRDLPRRIERRIARRLRLFPVSSATHYRVTLMGPRVLI